jgi:hypothetical protein
MGSEKCSPKDPQSPSRHSKALSAGDDPLRPLRPLSKKCGEFALPLYGKYRILLRDRSLVAHRSLVAQCLRCVSPPVPQAPHKAGERH